MVIAYGVRFAVYGIAAAKSEKEEGEPDAVGTNMDNKSEKGERKNKCSAPESTGSIEVLLRLGNSLLLAYHKAS